MLEPLPDPLNLPEEERQLLEFWREKRVFYKSCDQRLGGKEFVFYDGPPFATGLPHHGHLLVSTIKDVVARYATMKGFHVRRRFGWDCHGLPVEYEIEKSLKISGKKQIEEFGVDKFNQACRGIVDRYSSEWRQVITRLGRWVDFNDEYRTLDTPYMESVWWVFKSLWDKNLIYQGHRIQPYCTRCCTPLSNFETNQGYMDRQDPSVTVTCPTENGLELLVWTTTPWTLPSNTAVCVKADLDYDVVEKDGRRFVLASARRAAYFKDLAPSKTLKGRELVGQRYKPLFPFFADKASPKTFTVVADDYVSAEDGTGIVHQAPAFGEDDFRVASREGLPIWDPFDAEGTFQDPVTSFKGQKTKEADKDIIKALKDAGRLFHQATIDHSYPHCWRCDSPLIYRALSAWFMKIEPVKAAMLKANSEIHWVPEHLKEGRFGKWLEGARDWNLSRNRYWGAPIPVWLCTKGHTTCVGSRAELEKLSGNKGEDLHKEFMDAVSFPCPQCGEKTKRTSEVLDCWFESGAMPYAQLHYPFEEKAYFEKTFPADFIAEATDQTRGWFYSLTVLAAALFGKPAFRNVVVNGHLLAEDGRKMSKSKRNYTDPTELMETLGADPFRLALVNSAVVRGEPVRFGDESVREAHRGVILPLINSCQFLLTYAKADGWKPPAGNPVPHPASEIDRWILSRFQTLLAEISSAMAVYHLNKMVPPLIGFLDDLTNWYIRRSRRRFWKSEAAADKEEAFRTLHHVLLEFTKALAPVLPFTSELLYKRLTAGDEEAKLSVHLTDFPVADPALQDTNLERRMALARTLVTLGHSLRKGKNLRVRQPLKSITVVVRSKERQADLDLVKDLVLEELNVKAILSTSDETSLVKLSARPNLKVLGKRFGPRLKEITPLVQALSGLELSKVLEGGFVDVLGEKLGPEELIVDREVQGSLLVASSEGLTVALDPEVTRELELEGLARELVNRLQNLRKDSGLDVSDRIALTLHLSPDLEAAFEAHKTFVLSEVLATSHTLSPAALAHDLAVEGHSASAALARAAR